MKKRWDKEDYNAFVQLYVILLPMSACLSYSIFWLTIIHSNYLVLIMTFVINIVSTLICVIFLKEQDYKLYKRNVSKLNDGLVDEKKVVRKKMREQLDDL